MGEEGGKTQWQFWHGCQENLVTKANRDTKVSEATWTGISQLFSSHTSPWPQFIVPLLLEYLGVHMPCKTEMQPKNLV